MYRDVAVITNIGERIENYIEIGRTRVSEVRQIALDRPMDPGFDRHLPARMIPAVLQVDPEQVRRECADGFAPVVLSAGDQIGGFVNDPEILATDFPHDLQR